MLAASLDLSAPDRQLLSRQTDSPDAGRVKRWEALLSGYPLPSGLFAFSMTWPAFEMPRPGCVWTHTLLLGPEEISSMRAEFLLKSFRKPEGPEIDTLPYERPLEAANLENDSDRSHEVDFAGWRSAIEWALYDPPAQAPVNAVGVDLPDPVRHELLMLVWNSGWPALRAQFSFADAPRTLRRLGESAFDLQLHQNIRMTKSAGSGRVLRGIPEARPPQWTRELDPSSPDADSFREFLRAYGEEAEAERACMNMFAHVFRACNQMDSDGAGVRRAVSAIFTSFPEPDSGRHFKTTTLAPEGPPIGCRAAMDEVELLKSLLSAPDVTSVSTVDLRIGERATSLLNGSSGDVRIVLDAISDPKQPMAEMFIHALTRPASLDYMLGALPSESQVLEQLASLSPSLTHSPDVWRSADPDQLWAAARSQRRKDQRALTIAAMIESGNAVAPEVVIAKWRNSGALALDHLNKSHFPDPIVRRWAAAIGADDLASFVGDGSGVSPQILGAAIGSLASSQIKRIKTDAILSVVSDGGNVDLAANTFALALENESVARWGEVAVIAYQHLYKPALNGELDAASRKRLTQGSSASSREVASELAGKLNEALKSSKWQPLWALRIADRQAFAALADADGRAGLARRIVMDAASSGATITQWQQAILNRVIKQKSDRDALTKVVESLGKALFGFGRQ